MEFSIQGDIFFFYDTLSEEEKETVRKRMRARYKGHIVGDPKIDEFLEELERDHGIRLKRLTVTSVIAVLEQNRFPSSSCRLSLPTCYHTKCLA